jgi:hypothetical protein
VEVQNILNRDAKRLFVIRIIFHELLPKLDATP